MTAASFESLQDLWQTQPAVVEPDEAYRLLARAKRKARWLKWRDYLLFALALAAMIPNFTSGGTLLTWVVGLVFIAIMAAVTMRRHRRAVLSSGIGLDQKSALDGLVRLARGELRYRTVSAFAAAPFIFCVLFWKWYSKAGGDIGRVDEVIFATHPLRLAFVATALTGLTVWTIWKRRQSKAELRQLEDLARQYREEDAS